MFALSYFSVAFLIIIQVSSGDFLPPQTTNPDEERGINFGGPGNMPPIFPNYNQYIVLPQYMVPSGSILTNVPSVTLFTNTFLDAVYGTDILRQAFDTRLTTAKQYADFLRQYATNAFSLVGVENAAEVGEFAAQAIAPNFDTLTLPVLARAYCNTAAHFLFMNGDLGLDNAENFALSFAQAIADSAQVTMNSDPTSKFPAIANGFINFFDSLGLWTKKNSSLMGYLIGVEWFVAAANYRWF